MNPEKYRNYPEKACYELWGWDTFSSESYLCGVYASAYTARKAMRRHEEEIKAYQSKSLRDTYSINKTTIGEHLAERDAWWAQIRENHRLLDLSREIYNRHFDEWFDLMLEKSGTPGEYLIPITEGQDEGCVFNTLAVRLSVYEKDPEDEDYDPTAPPTYHLGMGMRLNYTRARYGSKSWYSRICRGADPSQFRAEIEERIQKHDYKEIVRGWFDKDILDAVCGE